MEGLPTALIRLYAGLYTASTMLFAFWTVGVIAASWVFVELDATSGFLFWAMGVIAIGIFCAAVWMLGVCWVGVAGLFRWIWRK